MRNKTQMPKKVKLRTTKHANILEEHYLQESCKLTTYNGKILYNIEGIFIFITFRVLQGHQIVNSEENYIQTSFLVALQNFTLEIYKKLL